MYIFLENRVLFRLNLIGTQNVLNLSKNILTAKFANRVIQDQLFSQTQFDMSQHCLLFYWYFHLHRTEF